MKIFLTSLLVLCSLSLPAYAGPAFFAALSAGAGFSGAFAATAVGGFLTSTTIGRLLMSVAFSALQAATVKKPKPPGIVTETTMTGSTQPLSFVMGLYATGGSLAAPPLAHGKAGKTPNAYRQYVITLGAVPGMTLSRLMINGEYVTLGDVLHPDYGLPIQGRYSGYAWVKYHDGTQTVADPMLLAKYGSDPDRPWTADMVGTGLCYAILTFRFSSTIWTSGEPSWRFELQGIPLYDPRKDTTVGGSGPHRWANRATWEPSNNPLVQAYNIKRGIELPGLGVWGGKFPADDLPLSDWFAAMNVCDQTVARPDDATEPRYRTGYEIKVSDEPADILEELFKASATQIAEVGGLWKPRTGGPGLPVWFMTDSDVMITSPQELDPFPGSDQRFNGVTATCPDPAMLWETQPVPDYTNAAWEAEDGGKRRLANLPLAACPYPLQAQRVIAAYAKDDRRFRRHNFTLPPDAAVLEPLDTIAWTSARNGYVTKHFEIGDMMDDPITILQNVALREVDPTDYVDAPSYGQIAPVIPTARAVIPTQVLAGFDALPGNTLDATGAARRPHVRLIWDGDEQDGVTGIEWETRLTATAQHVSRGSTSNVTAGELQVFDGILGNVSYQARARQIATWPVEWSSWVTVLTDDVRLGTADLADPVRDGLDAAAAAALEAAAVREDHDALVAGFTGDLATAFAESNARTAAGLNGWVKDPTFTDWVSGNLNVANWFSRSGVATFAVEAGGSYGGGLTVSAPSGTTLVEVTASTAVNCGLIGADSSADFVVAELEIDYIAGNPAGMQMRVEWSSDGVTWTRGDFAGATASLGAMTLWGLTPKPGARQVLRGLWKRPTGITGHMRLRFFAKNNSVSDAQQMVVHRLNLRAATQADIDAGQTYSIASSTPGAVVTHVGAGSAIAGLNAAFSARAGGLEGSVSSILGARADLLTGTALASLLTQLQVSSATGLSAWATAQAAAVTSLQGNASASYSFRVGAGGASAGLELVAFNNAQSGAASALKLSAQHIDLMASSVRISDPGNIFPDFDMEDARFYSSATASGYSFASLQDSRLGRRFVIIPASADAEDVASGWFPVEPSTEYLATACAWMTAASATVVVSVEFGSLANDGSVTPISAAAVVSRTNSNPVTQASVVITTPANARRARYRVDRAGGGTGQTRAGGFKLQKRAGSSLLVDGIFAVTGMAAFGGQLSSTVYTPGVAGWTIKADGSAEFNNLAVRQNMIVDDAVTRRKTARGAGIITVTGTSLWSNPVALTGEMPITLAPYVLDAGGGIKNPLMLTVTAAMRSNTNSAFKMLIGLQKKEPGGTWTTLYPSFMTAECHFPAADFDVWRNISVTELDLSGAATTGVEVIYRVVGFYNSGNPSVSVEKPICILEQVNK